MSSFVVCFRNFYLPSSYLSFDEIIIVRPNKYKNFDIKGIKVFPSFIWDEGHNNISKSFNVFYGLYYTVQVTSKETSLATLTEKDTQG